MAIRTDAFVLLVCSCFRAKGASTQVAQGVLLCGNAVFLMCVSVCAVRGGGGGGITRRQ